MNNIGNTKEPMRRGNLNNNASNEKNIRGLNNESNITSAQNIVVAKNCTGYTPLSDNISFTSSCGSSISCNTCAHLKDNTCEVGLYDKVLAGLDER